MCDWAFYTEGYDRNPKLLDSRAEWVDAVERNYRRLKQVSIGSREQLVKHDLGSADGEIVDDVEDLQRLPVAASVGTRMS